MIVVCNTVITCVSFDLGAVEAWGGSNLRCLELIPRLNEQRDLRLETVGHKLNCYNILIGSEKMAVYVVILVQKIRGLYIPLNRSNTDLCAAEISTVFFLVWNI